MGEKKEKKSKKEKKDKEDAPAEEASASEDAPAPAPAAEKPKKVGNVFALFNQAQITEFKEAFTMMDVDRDGFISEDDLAAIFQQTGREPDSKDLKEMIKEAPGQLNFTAFLTLFGEKMHGTDPESTLRDAFTMFDENKTGKIEENYMKHLLTEVGDLFTKDEVKLTWKEAPIEGGQLDYLTFVQYIKRGKEGED